MINKIKYEFLPRLGNTHRLVVGILFHFQKTSSTEIRSNLKWQEEGWGRLKATAKIGNHQWETAIWFDTKKETYLLPLKAKTRKKEKIEAENQIEVTLWI